MVKVVAISKGYFGGMIREMGDGFDLPDEQWEDKKRRPSWVKLDPRDAFGGKGDHDGDGSVGGSLPAEAGEGKPAKPARPGRKKAETVQAPETAPFADAPAPETAQGNGVVEALGGPAPDWLPQGDDTPVMATE